MKKNETMLIFIVESKITELVFNRTTEARASDLYKLTSISYIVLVILVKVKAKFYFILYFMSTSLIGMSTK